VSKLWQFCPNFGRKRLIFALLACRGEEFCSKHGTNGQENSYIWRNFGFVTTLQTRRRNQNFVRRSRWGVDLIEIIQYRPRPSIRPGDLPNFFLAQTRSTPFRTFAVHPTLCIYRLLVVCDSESHSYVD